MLWQFQCDVKVWRYCPFSDLFSLQQPRKIRTICVFLYDFTPLKHLSICIHPWMCVSVYFG